jgi:hypothetical protein
MNKAFMGGKGDPHECKTKAQYHQPCEFNTASTANQTPQPN